MPNNIDTLDLGDLYEFADEETPEPEQWNQNPLLFRAKINEMIAALNKAVGCVRSGFTGVTVLGKVYKLVGSALSLAAPTDSNLDCLVLGVGTGANGTIQDGDELTVGALGFSSYPCKVYLGAAGVIQDTPPTTAGAWVAPLGIARSATVLKIEINRFNFYRNGAGF